MTNLVALLLLCLALAPLGVLTRNVYKKGLRTFKRDVIASGLAMTFCTIATNYLFISELFK